MLIPLECYPLNYITIKVEKAMFHDHTTEVIITAKINCILGKNLLTTWSQT